MILFIFTNVKLIFPLTFLWRKIYNLIMKPNDKNKKKQAEQMKKFKEKYFDYYDDVKSHTHKIYDW